MTTAGAATYLPQRRTLADLRGAAQGCHGCDLYRHATQTVFGAGSDHARIVLVGEQPGDSEDRAGLPFVGPAGRLLRTALTDAGIAEDDVYITNAVKHFKFVERGKRRIHAKPKTTEMRACLPWLAAELAAIEPRVVVALGATAAQALLGSTFRLTEGRGTIVRAPLAEQVVATFHPSAILRAPDETTRHEQLRLLVHDLALAARAAADASVTVRASARSPESRVDRRAASSPRSRD